MSWTFDGDNTKGGDSIFNRPLPAPPMGGNRTVRAFKKSSEQPWCYQQQNSVMAKLVQQGNFLRVFVGDSTNKGKELQIFVFIFGIKQPKS
jgi:hypothetical protein